LPPPPPLLHSPLASPPPPSPPPPVDFNLEKQTLIHKAKLDVHSEFEKKEKEREVRGRRAGQGAI